MITKEEYKAINQYKTTLIAWRGGACVNVTRQMWEVLAPIAQKYFKFNGTLLCRYCCLELMRYCHDMWSEYKDAHKRKDKEVSDEQ